MHDKIVNDGFRVCYVKCGERMGVPYEQWIEIRCGTCKTTKTCEDKTQYAFQGCDKWQVE